MESTEPGSLSEPGSPFDSWRETFEIVYDPSRQVFETSTMMQRTPVKNKESNQNEDEEASQYGERVEFLEPIQSMKLPMEGVLETPEAHRKIIKEADEFLEKQERDRKGEEKREKRARNENEISFEEQQQVDKRSRLQEKSCTNVGMENLSETSQEPTTEQLLEVYKLIKAKITEAATRRYETAESGAVGKVKYALAEQKIILENLDTLQEVWAYMAYKAGRRDARQSEGAQAVQVLVAQNGELMNVIRDFRHEMRDMRKELKEGRNAMNELREIKQQVLDMRKEMSQVAKTGAMTGEIRQTSKPKDMTEIIREERRIRAERKKAEEEKERIAERQRYNITAGQGAVRKEVRDNREESSDDREDMSDNQNDEEWIEIGKKKRTYAKIAGGTREERTGANWKTPEKVDNLEIVVIVKNEQEPVKALQRVKQVLADKLKETGKVRVVQPLPGGRVVIRFASEVQRQIAITELSKRGDQFELKLSRSTKPTFTVTGVFRGYLEEEIKQMIISENEDIDRDIGLALMEHSKVVSRRQCRNDTKENVTFEAPSDIVKYMIRKEVINLDMNTTRIMEAVNVIICYNCHRFGHIARYCNYNKTCQHCGGSHDAVECREDIEDCINCRVFRIPAEKRRHSARDRDCPIYVRKENAARRRIQYTPGDQQQSK